MATFLWALQWGGLSITLVGLLREHHLAQRLAQRLPAPAPPAAQLRPADFPPPRLPGQRP
ncbi:MAG: hypothetical protein ACKOXO_12650 [Cyanobium sp.]